jgi:hypothetical protein
MHTTSKLKPHFLYLFFIVNIQNDLPEWANLPSFFDHSCARKVSGMKTPNQLSREAIEEFKAIYREEFGKILSDDEVQEMAMHLLRFFGILNEA